MRTSISHDIIVFVLSFIAGINLATTVLVGGQWTWVIVALAIIGIVCEATSYNAEIKNYYGEDNHYYEEDCLSEVDHFDSDNDEG